MSLWIECAHRAPTAGTKGAGDSVVTHRTERSCLAVIASRPSDGMPGPAMHPSGRSVVEATAELAARVHRETGDARRAVETALGELEPGCTVPLSLLHIADGTQAELIEVDAPPLFVTRAGELLLLPVLEEEWRSHLVRHCRFALQDGDYMAMVSDRYIRTHGWDRRWGWRDVAASVRRLTATRCDASQLLGALVGIYQRLAGSEGAGDVTVVALAVRPVRSVTVWSGPPTQRELDREALAKLMAEPGTRVICGDTTAEIAARLLGVELVMDDRPTGGWTEVPPTSSLAGVDLVTEGVVTMGVAHRRLEEARHLSDLYQSDGATRLARVLLMADKVKFLVGLAVNPAQVADADGKTPLRLAAVQSLAEVIRSRGKIVQVEYLTA